MFRSIRILGAVAALAVGRLPAQAIPSAHLAQGTLSFDAKATLGAFTGTTTTMTGEMSGAASIGSVKGWVEAPTKSLTTKNDHRDRDMASSLEVEKYPTIRYDLESATVGEVQGDSTAVVLHGAFTLHGKKLDALIPGWIWMKAGSTRFRGALPINVKDYGVGGLTKMLGMLKMNEMITVRIDVEFAK